MAQSNRSLYYAPEIQDSESFHVTELDQFGNDNEASQQYFNGEAPLRLLQTRGEPDNLFGRNKTKKAEKKIKKAQKQLAHGHIKKAEKKLKKAGVIQKQLSTAQTHLGETIGAQKDINATQENLNKLSTASNESQDTQAGQIGLAAMPTTTQPQQQNAGVGDGGMSSGGGGGYADTTDSSGGDTASMAGDNDEPTGKLAETKTMAGVTVTAHKQKLIYIIIAIAVLGAIIYFATKKK